MPEITLILGGARSGKSTYAEAVARADGREVTYLATADVKDKEMEHRVQLHKARRPASWKTWEKEPDALPSDIASMSGLLLLDCLTMWLSRLFLADKRFCDEDEAIFSSCEADVRNMCEKLLTAPRGDTHLVIVSNEVGYGLVPPYLMGRRFRDVQGRINQLAAGYATRVCLVVAGCPLWVKGSAPKERGI